MFRYFTFLTRVNLNVQDVLFWYDIDEHFANNEIFHFIYILFNQITNMLEWGKVGVNNFDTILMSDHDKEEHKSWNCLKEMIQENVKNYSLTLP